MTTQWFKREYDERGRENGSTGLDSGIAQGVDQLV